MGPRPRARKNYNPTVCYGSRGFSLQWGRARGRGKIPGEFRACTAGQHASMGPRPRARKNALKQRKDRELAKASMGPRPRARKNGPMGAGTFESKVASMGPRPRARKNLDGWLTVREDAQLQWGRARGRGKIA